MPLSNDLISRFVKITNDNKKTKGETVVYGTVSTDSKDVYVTIDGSDYSGIGGATDTHSPKILVTNRSVTEVKDGDRVTVLIKNHTAIVTGNLEDPSTTKGYTDTTVGAVAQALDKLSAEVVYTKQLDAETAKIKKAVIDEVDSKYVNTDELEANNAVVKEAVIDELSADIAKIDELTADNVDIKQKLNANAASIKELDTKKLSSEEAALTYANIDFSNITKAAMEYFYATSGLIDNVIVGDGTITGTLVGVTISGDVLEGNTVIAEKLVIKGEDGLYYKLNTDGVTTSAEQTDYNSLNGQVIKAKSVTADRISVSDLVAFDATVGGFHLTADSIYSDVKDSDGNTTRGIYMDTDGQFNFGDETNFVKYYRDDSGNYKLAISAESIMYALNGKQYSISDLGMIGDYVHIGIYESEPCILLGETDSDFKLVITNTRIMFMEGSDVPAYINNQSLHIKKAVIEEELQQGNFVWKIRSNGNMGLVWKGGSS